MNRAVGKRSLFDDEIDVHEFFGCLAMSVRRGEILIHAYSIMTTHFHLLLESLVGKLAVAMRRIESEYVRVFNRRHKRDGPLVRGRFRSKCVSTYGYWMRVIRYIDQNPVQAGVVAAPWLHPYGSATHYVNGTGPQWLERAAIEREVSARHSTGVFDGAGYKRLFGTATSPAEEAWLLSRVERGDRDPDPLPHLVIGAPEAIRQWLEERTRVADGTRAGVPVVDVDSLRYAMQALEAKTPDWQLGGKRSARNGWQLARVGLMRDLCGLTLQAISRRGEKSVSTIRERLLDYADVLRSDAVFRERVGVIAHAAIQRWAEDFNLGDSTANLAAGWIDGIGLAAGL